MQVAWGAGLLKFHNIQALRFVAALMVAVAHGENFYLATGGALDLTPYTGILFAGVDIFFVISGFIIWVTTRVEAGGADASQFAYRRAIRIYSTWWIVAAALLVDVWLGRPQRLANLDLVSSFLLIPQSHATNLAPITWTLSYELYFYLMMAMAIGLGGRRFIALPLAVAFSAAVLLKLGAIDMPVAAQFLVTPHLLEFGAGCAVAIFVERRKIALPWVWLLFGIVGFVAVAAWTDAAGINLGNGKVRDLRVALVLPCSVAVLIGLVGLEGRLSMPRLLVKLGDASYGIYLWHMLVFSVFRGWLIDPVKLPPVVAELTWMAIVVFLCAFSLASYRFIEQPVLKWLRLSPRRSVLNPV